MKLTYVKARQRAKKIQLKHPLQKRRWLDFQIKHCLFLIITLFLIQGCAKEHHLVSTEKLDQTSVSKIVKGVTTKKDIIDIFGAPETSLSLKERETLFYKNENLKALWIELDKNGIVINYQYSKI